MRDKRTPKDVCGEARYIVVKHEEGAGKKSYKFMFEMVYMLWFNFILGLNFIFFSFKLMIIH